MPAREIREAELADDDGYAKIRDDLRNKAVRAAEQNEEGMANYNIHRLKAIVDPENTGEPEPVVAKMDRKLRPGSREVEQPSFEYFGPDELDQLDQKVLDDRVGWSASPFVDRLEIDHERPEENVLSEKDKWVFDPSVDMLLDGVVNLDALGADICQSQNIPKADLASGTQNGVDDVKNQKIDVIQNKQGMMGAARQILRKVQGPDADQVALHTKTPMEIYFYVDEVIENADHEGMGEHKSRKLLEELNQLHDVARMLQDKRSNTEETSVQVFSDVLHHEGYGFPSTVSEPNEAITQHGVGTNEYLGI